MKKTLISLLLAFLLCFGLAACSDGPGTEPGGDTPADRGTLTIDDMTVDFQESATIQPRFSTEAGQSDITYTFDGQDIRIAGSTVTGLVGNTQTTVTAKTEYHETTFVVSVVFANPFGANAYTDEYDDVFAAVDDGVFRKESAAYGEAYYYDDGEALAGAEYLLTGTAELSEPAAGAEAAVIVRESANKYARFVYAYNGEDSYTLSSEYCNGGTEAGNAAVLRESDSPEFDFAVMAYDGAAYFFFESDYVGKVDIDFGNTHVGLGAENCVLELTRLRPYTDASRLQDYIDQATQTFGYHAYGGAVADPGVIVETDTPGVFRKTSTAYGQTFYYEDGLPLAGDSWRMDATVELVDYAAQPDDPSSDATLGQATFMVCKDDQNLVRFVFEYYWIGWLQTAVFQAFSDVKENGAFGSYAAISSDLTGGAIPNPLTFTLVYHEGVSYFIVGGMLVGRVEKDLGDAHFGFGGEACAIEYSNLHGSYDVSILDDVQNAFGSHKNYDAWAGTGANFNAGAIVATDTPGVYEKTDTAYQQMFLYSGAQPVAGTAYTVNMTVEMSDYQDWAQATFLICQDDNNLVRFVFEKTNVANEWQIFTDIKTAGNFGNWQLVKIGEGVTNPLTFTIIYSEGKSYFYLNGELLATVEKDLGETHFGVGGEKCVITYSNITATTTADFPASEE